MTRISVVTPGTLYSRIKGSLGKAVAVGLCIGIPTFAFYSVRDVCTLEFLARVNRFVAEGEYEKAKDLMAEVDSKSHMLTRLAVAEKARTLDDTISSKIEEKINEKFDAKEYRAVMGIFVNQQSLLTGESAARVQEKINSINPEKVRQDADKANNAKQRLELLLESEGLYEAIHAHKQTLEQRSELATDIVKAYIGHYLEILGREYTIPPEFPEDLDNRTLTSVAAVYSSLAARNKMIQGIDETLAGSLYRDERQRQEQQKQKLQHEVEQLRNHPLLLRDDAMGEFSARQLMEYLGEHKELEIKINPSLLERLSATLVSFLVKYSYSRDVSAPKVGGQFVTLDVICRAFMGKEEGRKITESAAGDYFRQIAAVVETEKEPGYLLNLIIALERINRDYKLGKNREISNHYLNASRLCDRKTARNILDESLAGIHSMEEKEKKKSAPIIADGYVDYVRRFYLKEETPEGRRELYSAISTAQSLYLMSGETQKATELGGLVSEVMGPGTRPAPVTKQPRY